MVLASGCGLRFMRSGHSTALEMFAAAPGTGRITVGADKCYDTREIVPGSRNVLVTPRVYRKQLSAIDRAHRPSRWISIKPAGQETSSGDLRLGEDSGRRPAAALLRRGPQPVLYGGDHRWLQPGAAGQTDAGGGVIRRPSLSSPPPVTPNRASYQLLPPLIAPPVLEDQLSTSVLPCRQRLPASHPVPFQHPAKRGRSKLTSPMAE